MSSVNLKSEDLSGEVDGVSSKGVEDWVFSTTSKLESLDDGLVVDRDGVNLAENGVWSSVILKSASILVGCFFKKHPKLSLFCPFSVATSIANCIGEFCRAA